MTGKAKKNILGNRFPDLIKEWDLEKNDGLTAFDVTAKGSKKIWWRCAVGHSWQAHIYNRTSGAGCPYCSGHRASPERNFAIKFPEMAKQWHPTKNGESKPSDLLPMSNKAAWWICSTGHEWQAAFQNRAITSGECPHCYQRKIPPERSFARRFPDIAKEWNYAKNGALTPFDVTFGSTKSVWWICQSGHEWQTKVYNRARNRGCHYCSGNLLTSENSLAERHPHLISEWNTLRNGGISAFEVAPKSDKKQWWKCRYGHEWESSPSIRTKQKMCPFCSGKRVSKDNNLGILFPKLVGEWHPTKNGSLTPFQVTSGSGRKVWWVCEKNGHEWQSIIANRARGSGCLKCHQNRCLPKTGSPKHFLDLIQKKLVQADLNTLNEEIQPRKKGVADIIYKEALTKSVEVINSLRGRLREYDNRLKHGEAVEQELQVTTMDRIALRKESNRLKQKFKKRTKDLNRLSAEFKESRQILRKTSSELKDAIELYEKSTKTIGKQNKKIQELQQQAKLLTKKAKSATVMEPNNLGTKPDYAIFSKDIGATPSTTIEPIIPVEEAVGEYGITCLICGVQLHALVWHLKVSHGMTPDFYRNNFDLPGDFPLHVKKES
jgi:hypothetical protein